MKIEDGGADAEDGLNKPPARARLPGRSRGLFERRISARIRL